MYWRLRGVNTIDDLMNALTELKTEEMAFKGEDLGREGELGIAAIAAALRVCGVAWHFEADNKTEYYRAVLNEGEFKPV